MRFVSTRKSLIF
eukprot:CCRYP_020971-RB/>CCRYP_020971-RB protein AED:0.45 eAED:1.00 QI:0/-1/0/1/-1/0/1/0/12